MKIGTFEISQCSLRYQFAGGGGGVGGTKQRNMSKYQQDSLFQIDVPNYPQHRSQSYLCIPHALNEEYQ